ncbi:MAG TPA: hypothetical protein VGQ06_02125 [Gemmatimonadales bacterium]|jgi:hypothetical protein|nr:hypothetical protein [Gemmatimonadales bacterium]
MISPRLAPAFLGLAFAASPAAAQAVQGQRYTLRMTSEGASEIIATVREGNGRARIDFERSHGGPESYILVNHGTGTVVFVRPEEREYTVVDDTTFERIVGKALRMVTQSGVVQVQLRDVRITPERLGAGEPIAGRPTQRYRLTQEYRAYVGAFGIVGDEPVHQTVVTEYWVSPRLSLPRNPLVELLAGVETALAQKSASFVHRSAAARDSLFRGMPLRIVVTARSGSGDEPTKERRIEVTDLGPAELDPAIWTIPRGYKQRQGDFSFEIN